jgi:hypothetical protein
MNIRQKKLIANIVAVTVLTMVMIVGFGNIKNSVNRSEAIRAMNILSKEVFAYREKYGSLPSESFVNEFIEQASLVRLTPFQYRAAWIDYGSEPKSTILAYSQKCYSGLVKSGYVVLWLNGNVEWVEKNNFDSIINKQQKTQELQWIKEHFQNEEK